MLSKKNFVATVKTQHVLKKNKIKNFVFQILSQPHYPTPKLKFWMVTTKQKLEIQIQFFQNFEKSNQNTYCLQRPISYISEWIQKGDLLSDCSASTQGELSLGKNVFVGYMSWEGLNFEDAVVINEQILSKYMSLHIEKYEIEICEDSEKILASTSKKFEKNGLPKIGAWIQEGEILLGKLLPKEASILLTHEKLLYDIVGEKKLSFESKYYQVPSSGRVLRICYTHVQNSSAIDTEKEVCVGFKKNAAQRTVIKRFHIFPLVCSPRGASSKLRATTREPSVHKKIVGSRVQSQFFYSLKTITIYIAEKRVFQVGDKISGRHGNKGIISKIFSKSDMPYLPNGCPLDVLLNPLGVPSRMNVGQIFECLLGFVGQIFQTSFQILCFDEIYGYEASRSFIYSKLFECCKKTQQKWLLSKESPGKFHLFDGRTGDAFHQSILVGSTYLMKLLHIVDEKIHARSTGPYSFITQQPLRGRAKHGGQRFGEMEVWALQGFGSAYAIQELLTVKSDDLQGRNKIMQTLLKNIPFKFGTPESLRVVLRELQCLCLQLEISK